MPESSSFKQSSDSKEGEQAEAVHEKLEPSQPDSASSSSMEINQHRHNLANPEYCHATAPSTPHSIADAGIPRPIAIGKEIDPHLKSKSGGTRQEADDDHEYIPPPNGKFDGPMDGYAFQDGPRGIGYYRQNSYLFVDYMQ
jgi:hypothetical protein